MNKIKDIIMSGTEPSIKENGWLVPNKDGKLELRFFGPNGWETVSSEGSSGDLNIYILPEPDGQDAGEEVTNWTKEMVEEAYETYSSGGLVLMNYADMTIAYNFVAKNEDNSIQLTTVGYMILPTVNYSEQFNIGAQYFMLDYLYNPTTEKTVCTGLLGVGNALQHYFEVDDTLYLTPAESNTFDPDTLGIKDGGVTLAKLASDVPIYQPPKITFSGTPKEGDVISNWTRDVWDRVNDLELSTIKVEDVAYYILQQRTDEIVVAFCDAGIIDSTLKVGSIQYGIKWDSTTKQTKLFYYSNANGTAIQTPTLPTIKTLPGKYEVITEWTAANFNACKNGFEKTPKVYHQVFIEGKLYTPIAVGNDEYLTITLANIEVTTDNLIKTSKIGLSLGLADAYDTDKVVFTGQSSHVGAGCITKTIYTVNKKLVGFVGTPDEFQEEFGVPYETFFYTEGTLTIRAHWFNVSKTTALTAVSCTYDEDELEPTTVFSDGTNVVTVKYISDDEEFSITSTPILTEGQAPTMAQFNALSTQVGNIDTVLTQIMGE